jgi:hypothetical protein
MDKNLKHFYGSDPGFAEFADRFDLAAADSETIAAYERRSFQQAFIDQELRLREEAGMAKDMAKGREEVWLKSSLAAFRKSSEETFESAAEMLRSSEFPEGPIQTALNQVKAERAQKTSSD